MELHEEMQVRDLLFFRSVNAKILTCQHRREQDATQR